MSKANRVTYHHEGDGKPTDNVARFLDTDKYSVGIGITRYDARRPPSQSFHTIGQPPGDSLQVCFSGDRRFYAVSDSDLELVRQAIAEVRRRGWITDNPDVYLHYDTHQTACPGPYVEARRAELAAIAKGQVQPPATPSTPVPTTPLPPPTTVTIHLGDDVDSFKWNGVLPADGRGFFDVPGVTEDKVIAITVTTRGYNDPSRQVPIFTTLEYGKSPARVLLWGGTPGVDYTVHVAHA